MQSRSSFMVLTSSTTVAEDSDGGPRLWRQAGVNAAKRGLGKRFKALRCSAKPFKVSDSWKTSHDSVARTPSHEAVQAAEDYDHTRPVFMAFSLMFHMNRCEHEDLGKYLCVFAEGGLGPPIVCGLHLLPGKGF